MNLLSLLPCCCCCWCQQEDTNKVTALLCSGDLLCYPAATLLLLLPTPETEKSTHRTAVEWKSSLLAAACLQCWRM
jgi:hypothetical protein